MARRDRAEPRQHDEVAGGLLPARARQAFSKWDAFARCGQRGSVWPEWPLVGLTGQRQAGNCCEPNSRCVSIHCPPPVGVCDLLTQIQRMEAGVLMRCRVET